MALSVSIELVSSSARVTSVKSYKRQFVTDGHPDTKIGPGTPGSDKNHQCTEGEKGAGSVSLARKTELREGNLSKSWRCQDWFTGTRSGTLKVRNSGLGPDPDHSAKNGPEKVWNWAQGPDSEHQEGGFSIVLGGPYCH